MPGTLIDLHRVGAFVHFEPSKTLKNTWLIHFYNISLQHVSEDVSKLDTVQGFFYPSELDKTTFGSFVDMITRKAFVDGTIGILKFVRVDYENFLFKDKKSFDQVWISTEPVLIDPDFRDNEFCAQFCWNGLDKDMLSKSMPRFIYSLELQEPMFPANYERACPYTTPILNTMRPEDIEEFYNGIFYNQVLCTDFVLVRSSREAAGYDIELGELLDNSKDFTCPGEFKEALKKQFVVKSKYLYDIILPYFYAHPMEMNGRSNDFMLRSSISRRGITITWTVLEDKLDTSKGQSVQLTIHNHNNYDVIFLQEANKQDASQFPWRFIQYVPSMEFQFYLNKLSPDDKAKFLGVSLVQNDKSRKEKI